MVNLLPGSITDPIVVELQAVSLENPGVYRALSYAWGSKTSGLRVITCNGHDFKVTANLFAALRRFRDVSESRKMWIDAICINQNSIPERTQQVGLMLWIYARAEEVLAWVGEDTADSDLEFTFRVANARYDYALGKRLIERPPGDIPLFLFSLDTESLQLVATVQKKFSWENRPHSAQTEEVSHLMDHPNILFIGTRKRNPGEQCLMVLPDFDASRVQLAAGQEFENFDEFLKEATKPAELELSEEEILKAFRGLLELSDRQYWKRAWIVQEIVASNTATIVCGKYEISFESFCAVYGYQRRLNLDIKNFVLDDVKWFDAAGSTALMKRLFQLADEQKIPLSLNSIRGAETLSSISYYRIKGLHQELNNMTLGELLAIFRKQMATDPRDHVFSFVGLVKSFSKIADEVAWCENAVDYSLGPRAVFLNAAKHIAEVYRQRRADERRSWSYHILDDFFTYGHTNYANLGLPTWVPNWTSEMKNDVVFDTRRIREIDTLIPYDGCVKGESLFLSGHIVDEVEFRAGPLGRDSELYREVELWTVMLQTNYGSKYGTDDARFEAFWRTVIADNPLGTKSPDDLTYHFKELDAVNSWVSHCRANYEKLRQIWSNRLKHRSCLGPLLSAVRDIDVNQDLPLEEKMEAVSYEFLQLAKDIGLPEDLVSDETHARTFFLDLLGQESDPRWESLAARSELSTRDFIVTKGDYFGLAPPGVELGDAVAILAGSAFPWYLRRRLGHFVLVGQAWIHGLMYKNDTYYRDGRFKDNVIPLELQ